MSKQTLVFLYWPWCPWRLQQPVISRASAPLSWVLSTDSVSSRKSAGPHLSDQRNPGFTKVCSPHGPSDGGPDRVSPHSAQTSSTTDLFIYLLGCSLCRSFCGYFETGIIPSTLLFSIRTHFSPGLAPERVRLFSVLV